MAESWPWQVVLPVSCHRRWWIPENMALRAASLELEPATEFITPTCSTFLLRWALCLLAGACNSI